MTLVTTVEQFKAEVEAETGKSVIVDVYAEWCGPCKKAMPVVESFVSMNEARVKLVKVNADDAEEVARYLGISSLPTVLVYKGGQNMRTHLGFRNAEDLMQTLRVAL